MNHPHLIVTTQPRGLSAHRRWINPPAKITKPAEAGWRRFLAVFRRLRNLGGGFIPRRRQISEQLRLFFLLLLLALAASACQSYRIADLLTESGGALFKDDFSDPSSGWARSAAASGSMDYFGGGFRIWVDTVNYDLWSTPGLAFRDVRIETDVYLIGGPVENRFGLLCRYRDPQNYYFFIVSSDGYYGIGKLSGGVRTLLGQPMMAYSAAITRGIALNHLRADCIGQTLTLYVNGAPVGMAQDADLPDGDVGLLAGTFDEPGADAVFDNFVVIKP
jgi:hypothetical protein